MAELGAAEASAAARNIAVMSGIGAEKMLLLEGRPTEISSSRSPDDILRAIEAIAGRFGERPEPLAIDVPEADVIEEP